MNQVGISLGWCCDSATRGVEIGLRQKKDDGYKTCPFDLCITNYPNIVQCIKDDFKYFCDDNYLKFTSENMLFIKDCEPKYIYNTMYNFAFNHESPEEANLYITENWPEGKNHFLLDNYKNFKLRYQERINNFKNYLLDENNFITFIVQRYNTKEEDLFELKNALLEKYPKLKFKFHIIDENSERMYKHLRYMNFKDEDEEVKRILENK